MAKAKVAQFVAGFVLLLSTITCAGPAPEKSPVSVSPLTSPIEAPSTSSHAPPPTVRPEFILDEPLKAESTMVTGAGPANVPIKVVDITRMGRELGTGVIGSDGNFAIEVSPLIQGDRIGIMLGDVTGTDIDPADYSKGESYSDIPMIGVVFDTAMVE